MRVAVIPARGGSKRIPRKNIREFCGRPMLAWPIAAARDSGCFDRIIVSTDDGEIAAAARAAGAETPFVRPAHLSDDHTPTVPVIAHAIDQIEAQGQKISHACCIYATAPFVEAGDLRRGLQTLAETGASFAFTATSFAFPIQRAMRLLPTGRVEMFQPEHALTRSQDLEEAYHDAGQFYWGTAAAWRSGKPIIGPDAAAVILPRHRVQDIDTMEDWVRAEAMFKAMGAAD
jgi:pseudaminic acid cytidylyltransferase